MSIRKVTIDRFDGGIITSERANNVNGMSHISHFDILTDPFLLKPLPAWESCVTDQEKSLGILSLGVNDSATTIIGSGKAIDWLSPSFAYRIPITLKDDITNYVSRVTDWYGVLDLSQLGDEFWNNVNTVGASNVVLTNANHKVIAQFKEVDVTNKTGYIYFNNPNETVSFTEDLIVGNDLYLYFGGTGTATFITETGFSTYTVFDGCYRAMFGNDNWGNIALYSFPGDADDLDTTYLVSGAIETGEAVLGKYRTSYGGSTQPDDANTGLGYPGNTGNFIVSCWFKSNGQNGELLSSTDSAWNIALNGSGQVQYSSRDTGNTTRTLTTTTAYNDNQWHHVAITFQDSGAGSYVGLAVDGSDVQTTATTGLENDISSTTNVRINTPVSNASLVGSLAVGDIFMKGTSVTETTFPSYANWIYSMYTSSSDTIEYGALDTYEGRTNTSSGVAAYQKSVSAAGWNDVSILQTPVKVYELDLQGPVGPTPGNVAVKNFINLHFPAEATDSTSFYYQRPYIISGLQTFTAPVISSFEVQGSLANSYPMVDTLAQDDSKYITFETASVYELDSTGLNTTPVFTSNLAQSTANYGGYLAIAKFSNARNFIGLWDRDAASTAFDESIFLGGGELRYVGNTGGTLFGVVDNNISNEDLSNGNPSMDIRVWLGGTTVQTAFSIPAATSLASTDYPYETARAIMNFPVTTKNASLFYAKIPTNEAKTEFKQGLWAVGKNDITQQLSLSLFYDTSDLGFPSSITQAGDRILMAHSLDGSVVATSKTDYSKTSLVETLRFDDGRATEEKNMKSIAVSFEPLKAGQTIVAYYRKDAETTWTRIFTHTETDSVRREATYVEATGANLPSFKEIQFKVESSGGSSGVSQIQFSYETLNTVQ